MVKWTVRFFSKSRFACICICNPLSDYDKVSTVSTEILGHTGIRKYPSVLTGLSSLDRQFITTEDTILSVVGTVYINKVILLSSSILSYFEVIK